MGRKSLQGMLIKQVITEDLWCSALELSYPRNEEGVLFIHQLLSISG